MFGFKKGKKEEKETEKIRTETVAEQEENTKEVEATLEKQVQEKKAADADTSENENVDRKEPEKISLEKPVEELDSPLTRPVRIILDTMQPDNQQLVERTAYECDKAIVLMDSLVGAYRTGDQKEFKEKHTSNCVVSGYQNVGETIRALLEAQIAYLKLISGDKTDALYTNAVRAASLLLTGCGIPEEHLKITADEWYMQQINAESKERSPEKKA